MCGIIMMASTEGLKGWNNRSKAFTQGILVDTLRGPHSTGLCYVDESGTAEIYKKPIPGYDFISTGKYTAIAGDVDKYPFLIAHNRWATKGAVNTDNAHPFQHGNITGVHNGSLFTYKNLMPNAEYATDSEYIIAAINDRGAESVLKELDGAFALVWHDASDNTLHVVRNDERPFYIGNVKGANTIIGASELEMLDLICTRNDLELDERYDCASGNEFIFNLKDLKDPEILERDLREENPWASYNYGNRSGRYSDSYYPSRKKEMVRALVSDFKLYSDNGIYGYVEALGIAAPYYTIRINGWTKPEYESSFTKDGYFEVEIASDVILSDGTRYKSADKRTVTWLTETEAYKGFNYTTNTFDDVIDAEYAESYTDDDEDEERVGTVVEKLWYKLGTMSLTKAEARHKIKHGCGTCGDPIPLKDFDELDWWNDEPICPACQLNGMSKLYIG